MKRTTLLLPCIAAVLITHSAAAQVAGPAQWEPPRFTDPERVAKLTSGFAAVDSVFRAFADRQHIPGAAWGIVVDGELAHLGMMGYRDLDSRSPVEANSVFRIASMSKSFAAMSILSLRDRGLLSLDDPAEKYVPELAGLVYPTTDSPRITIRHLLTHSAGFPEDNPWGDQQLAITDAEMSELMKQGIPFSNPPGTTYEYSNFGFAILGRIVANVSGMPYAEYLEENVLRPLGMTSTTLSTGSVAPDRLVQGYRWEDEQWKLEPQLPDGAFGAMGGILTSLSDLGTYVGVLLGAYPPRDGAEEGPVSRASLREMQQEWRSRAPQATVGDDGNLYLWSGGYGYGLATSSDCNVAHIVSHSGGLPGFGSLMRWHPDYGVGIIAFGNRTYSGWGGTVAQAFEILGATGGLEPRVPQPSAALVKQRDAVSRLVVNWNSVLADSVAAMNLFLDRSADRRQAEIAALLEETGECEVGSGFEEVVNPLRGSWILPCERGALRVYITLSPTTPPLVQHLQVSMAPATLATVAGRCSQ